LLERLSDLFICRGVPDYVRSDNVRVYGPPVRDWLQTVEVKTLFIEPGSPWENGYVESFNGKLRDELLNRGSVDTLLEAKVLIERCGRRTHGPTSQSLGYQHRRGSDPALFARFGYASASEQGWPVSNANTNLVVPEKFLDCL